MDIIEINSSESDVDSDFFDFTDSDDDNGTIASNRFISPNHDSDNSANFATQQPQKRALPSYFHQAADRPTSKPGTSLHMEISMPPQQREPARLEPYNGSEMGPNRIPYRKREFDAKLYRTFPEGSMEPRGATQFHNFPGTSNGYGGANSSDSKVHNGERRTLPSSLINGNSSNHAREKASMDATGNDQRFDFHAKSSHSMGPNAAHRFPPIKNEKLPNITVPKASVESRDEKGTGNYRVLPPTLIHGKIINGSHSNVTIGNISHSGIGEERHLEHDERIIYQEVLQNLGQPKLEDDLPDGLLSVHLLKHQKIALAWMVQKETSVHCAGGILADDQGLGKTISTIALIQKQMTLQSKFTSDDSHPIRSEALNLDEDDDGVIEVDEPLKVEMDDQKIENVEKKKRPMASTSGTSHNSRPAAGTLVVCPASVLRQWERELHEKVTETAKLSVLIYHGGTRTRNPCDLAKYDVVLTTYSLITNEVPRQNRADDDEERRNLDKYGLSSDFSTNKKRKQTSNTKKKGKKTKNSHLDFDSGPLARVRWFRVVLDEAQTIKNHRTQVARACCGLRAKRRWCLSGTPMQNSIDDLYSYFRFLKYDPYAVYSSFCSTIKCPISRNPSQGYKKLQAVLKVILLRRTKETLINGEPIVKLPPKTVSLKKIEFSEEERAFYKNLEADSRQQFKEYAAAGTVKQNYANILLMLLRLRQACDHPILVKKHHSNNVEKHSLDMARQLPREMRINLLNMLNSSSICRLCNDTPEDAVVTMCGHVFCYQCVSYRVTGDENECPAVGCKEMLGTDLVYSRATLKSSIPDNPENSTLAISSASEDESSITQSSYVSSKISATVEILNSMCNQSAIVDPTNFDWNYEVPVKAIVFSQWTGMLDLVETSLNHSLIQYRRLDGSMTLNSRDMAVKDFNNDSEVTVMLMSLKAGNLGLNMTAASHVILLDLWWNSSAEDQAIDRAHRIGQTRPVLVSRLTVGDTVEDRILKLQEEKRQMIASTFGQDQVGGPATRLTVEDLRYLFGIYG